MQGTQALHTEQPRAHFPPAQSQQMHPPPQKQPKALRFVTNYGAPHPKRRRVGAACLTCRKRKTACSGERPTCDTCKQNKLECAGYSSDAPTAPGQRKEGSESTERRTSPANEGGSKQHSNRLSPPDQISRNPSNIDPTLTQARGDDNFLKWGRSDLSPGAFQSHGSDTQGQMQFSNAGGEGVNSLFPRPRDRMPYFRWLGPTAIMPGFKQMVVKVKRQDGDPMARSSTNGEAPGRLSPNNPNDHLAPGNSSRISAQFSTGQSSVDNDARPTPTLPFYDSSPMPPSELITHLANTFFTHLGCNYPFLQRERFLRDLEEKQVDAILVDAVCALAARFSTHPLLTSQTHLSSAAQGQNDENTLNKATPAEYGHVFAQRAKAALVDAFAVPSVAAVQAALLLAYLEFGESRDSGLWMYLGISIRMAQDLGLHTVEGLKYVGMGGPTPKIIRRESSSDSKKLSKSSLPKPASNTKDEQSDFRDMPILERVPSAATATPDPNESQHQIEEQKAVEQERSDTFWAVFLLDRVVSSGTGRRSTLRDKDIELSFPDLDEPNQKDGWPEPFPALIRIIHLYGRVADLLNGIKEESDITSETAKRLAAMEAQVTQFYQGLSPKLHFDAVNFQHYVKAGEGTNFVLLHFWFHTLIVLLHQPTLFKTFEGKILQLFPNSQQLSMSSAKTIADILSYSQLIDAKASLGNPFTSQPIYIAACAFLKETAEQTVSSSAQSRASSPSRKTMSDSRPVSRPESSTSTPQKRQSMEIAPTDDVTKDSEKEPQSAGSSKRPIAIPLPQHISDHHKSIMSKHTLLATAATQHYQLCYKALQSLETYWAGAKYILTILDQKFEGVEDPLLYTIEESESSMERPRPVPEFKSPGWRRKLIWDPALPGAYLAGSDSVGLDIAQSPFWKARRLSVGEGDPSKAIGWTLTGTMNSPSTNLAWHYPSGSTGGMHVQQMPTVAHYGTMPPPAYSSPSLSGQDPSVQTMHYVHQAGAGTTSNSAQGGVGIPSHPHPNSGMSSVDAADLLLGLNNPYQNFRNSSSTSNNNFSPPDGPSNVAAQGNHGGSMTLASSANMQFHNADPASNPHAAWMTNPAAMHPFGDMMIESQDVDMSMLGLDMMPWFDSYPTHDMTGMLDPRSLGGSTGADGSGNMRNSTGGAHGGTGHRDGAT